MPWWLNTFWDWFWYYRRGKVRYRVYDYGDTYNAMASNGNMTVCNCYGSTREQAMEMARARLQLALNKEEKEKEIVVKADHYIIYREK